ncbi:MAG: hypothetical protein WKF43_17675 [Acidimicrobiales bacterium]
MTTPTNAVSTPSVASGATTAKMSRRCRERDPAASAGRDGGAGASMTGTADLGREGREA